MMIMCLIGLVNRKKPGGQTPENSGHWDKNLELIFRGVDITPDICYIYFSWKLFYLKSLNLWILQEDAELVITSVLTGSQG